MMLMNSAQVAALQQSTTDPLRSIELVEDDPSMQKALALALRHHGYAVYVYGSRREFAAAARPIGPRVVMLDMRLPDTSGLELRDWLTQHQDNASVIFISGQSSPEEIIDALKGGADDFLLKPFPLERLLQALERAFERQEQRLDHALRVQRLEQGWARLTRREREVCVLMLKGMANREIARLHGTVPGTVKVQRARVMEKMGVASLSDLFRRSAGTDLASWLDRPEDDA